MEVHGATVAVAESDAVIKCSERLIDCTAVEWMGYNRQKPYFIILQANQILYDFRDRYSVDNSSGCNLLIKNASLTDAGRFICQYHRGKSTVLEVSFLIILEFLPKCSTQVNASSEGIAAEGDEVQFTCELRFNAIYGASMTWKTLENASIYVKPNTTGRLLHSVVVGRSEIPSYECITKFDFSKEKIASCATQPIRPLYGVTTVTLTPSFPVYSLGSAVTCSADGLPNPSYQWQIADDEKKEIWRDIFGETGNAFKPSMTTENIGAIYRCSAKNTVRNKSFVAFSRTFATYRAVTKEESSTPRLSDEKPPETSIGLTTFAIVISVAVLLCIFSVVITRLVFKRKYGSVATGTRVADTDAEDKYQNLNGPTSQLNVNGEISEHYDAIELYDIIDEYSLEDPNYAAIQDNEYLEVIGETFDENAEAEENDQSAATDDHQSEQKEENSGYQAFLVQGTPSIQ